MLRRAVLLLMLAFPAPAVLAAEAPSAVNAGGEPRIPFRRGEDGVSGVALRVIGGFIVVVLLGIGGVYLLKRYLPTRYRATPGGAGHIKVVEAQRLTPKVTLFLLDVDGARLLIAHAGERVTRLYEDANTLGGRSATDEHRR